VTTLAKTAASALALCLALGLAPAAFAQAASGYQAPRTAFGAPDLQGIWSNASVTRLERPDGYPLVLTREQADRLEGGALYNQRLKTESSFVDPNLGAPEAGKPLPPVGNYDVAWTDPGSTVANINGELRSSFIVFPENGKLPALTEEGKHLRAAAPRRRGSGFDHPEERGLSERCIIIGNAGPPLGQYLYNNNFQIVQSPSHFMLMSEMIHDVRVAPIGGAHRSDGVEPWMGDSVARWEGDTLVVETRAIHPTQRGYGGVFLSDQAKVTERFTRISDKQILYAFEIDDPKVYTSRIKAEMPLYKLDAPLFEYACHEGNYGLENILSGGRKNDREGRAQTGGESRGE
jgi:hypothetical protein